MSEDLNRDPLVAKLVRLTPTAAGLDRESMLFAAGLASAPKADRWKIATTLLGLTQVATLALWLAASRWDRPADALLPIPNASPVVPSSPSDPLPATSYVELVRRSSSGELPTPAAFADPLPATPTLSIATSRHALDD